MAVFPPQLSLPPAQTFDILPSLHELLARIDHGLPSNNPANPTSTSAADLLPPHSSASDPLEARYTDLHPLDPKDLPTEILDFKQKIRAAIKALKDLPDMERSVEDQEEEIREMNYRRQEQEKLLKRLGVVVGELKARVESTRSGQDKMVEK